MLQYLVYVGTSFLYQLVHMYLCFVTAGKNNLGGKKEQEIKEQYQEKLSKMESELKQLKAALKRHQHIIKSKVFSQVHVTNNIGV